LNHLEEEEKSGNVINQIHRIAVKCSLKLIIGAFFTWPIVSEPKHWQIHLILAGVLNESCSGNPL